MHIVNWNIEWMNNWFSGNRNPSWGTRQPDDDSPRQGALFAHEAQEAAGRVANVIRALDPDLITVQEGPSSTEEMALFIADFLSDDDGPLYDAMIGSDGRTQKMYALIKRDGAVETCDYATDASTQELLDDWEADVDGDLLLESYGFTRTPLVVDVDPRVGQPFRTVVLHTKSKYVHRGQQMFQNPATRQRYVEEAMLARRRISAEGYRIRAYLDALVKDDPEARIIVTGDFNDGPGKDYFERKFLTHNVADIVLGSTFYPELIFQQPMLTLVPPPALFTARFDDFVDNEMNRQLLLDHFIVSPALRSYVADAGIAHDAFEAELAADGDRERSKRPSDHRPIYLTLQAPLTD